MNAKQFRTARDRLALDNYQIADLLGISARSARRFAEGARDINEPTARLLRLILALDLTPDKVTALLHKGGL